MNNNVCFIILHYGEDVDITRRAVDSIRKLTSSSIIDIIIVCNGKQYDVSEEFKDTCEVLVIDNNIGFSAGNNIGYLRAKSKGIYDFIIIINNDIIIEQKSFLAQLFDLYKVAPFYVAGPDVYTPGKDYHSSPLSDKPYTVEQVEKFINLKHRMIERYNSFFSFKCFKLYLGDACKEKALVRALFKGWRLLRKYNKNWKEQRCNVVLQGSCLIFSRDFIDVNEKAFEPEVFLYYEEHYLARRCSKNNWTTMYFNSIQVMHYHRGSSRLKGLGYREYCNKKIEIENQYIEAAKLYKKNMSK